MVQVLFTLLMTANILICSTVTFIFFYADTDDKGWIGVVSRFLLVTCLGALKSNLLSLFGQSAYDTLYGIYDYTVNQRNPLLQIFYLLLLNGIFITWLIHGHPHIPPSLENATLNYHYTPFIGVVCCHIAFYCACFIGPGHLTTENIDCYDHSPYDEVLFVKGKMCSTCNLRKPARSKHCSLCKACIPGFDHHCVWLNQCVGERNYKYFLGFLITNGVFFTYASIFIFYFLIAEINDKNLWSAKFYNSNTKQQFEATPYILMQYVLTRHLSISCAWALVTVADVCIIVFLFMHIYQVWIGTTTNEFFKWRSVRKYHNKLIRAHERYLERERTNPGWRLQGGVDAAVSGAVSMEALTVVEEESEVSSSSFKPDMKFKFGTVLDEMLQRNDGGSVNKDTAVSSAVSATVLQSAVPGDNVDIGCVSVSPAAVGETQSKSKQEQQQSKDGARKLKEEIDDEEADEDGHVGIPEFLDKPPIPFPKNIYDKGVLTNFW